MGRKSRKSRTSSRTTKYPTAETIAGQRRQVWEGRAERTKGGLTRADLMMNKQGKIVSKRASRASKKAFERNGLVPDRTGAFRGARSVERIDWERLLPDEE
jgi:hypothetical protein